VSGRRRQGSIAILTASLALVLSACGLITGGPSQPQETLSQSQETGVVVSLDSPALGQVDGFELLTQEGTILAFDTTELEFDPDFPASHVAEHQVLGDPVRVTYRADGDRLVVTQLEDAE
jgi:hypothetical protein